MAEDEEKKDEFDFDETGEALGYIPSPIPLSEAFTAIQTGVVDRVIGSGADGMADAFRPRHQSAPSNRLSNAQKLLLQSSQFGPSSAR